ncbi:hypothetical protein D3C72_2149140 [compost metagenome]
MRQRRHAADGKTGLALDEIGVGTAELAALGADDGLYLLFVHAQVARGDDQHGGVVALAAEDDALGDLAQRHAQRVGGLLGGARGVVEHDRGVGVAQRGQRFGDAQHAGGQIKGVRRWFAHGREW